jgi:prepilin-type N-terminal cleavage/methylation domain-containing protein
MRILRHNHPFFRPDGGFTLAEVLVAISVAVMFGLAAFATNERLLVALKAQKETTAASMVLQERMELLRSLSFTNVTLPSNIGSNIGSSVINSGTTSEAPLSGLNETITVSAYPADGSTNNQWVRNSTYAAGHPNSTNSTWYDANGNPLPARPNLVQADILITWTSANGRTRTRELAAIFGIGNLGQ